MPIVGQTSLEALAAAILQKTETPNEIANCVSTSLMKSNLMGHDSHGVALLPIYLEKIRQKQISPDARPLIAQEEGAVVQIDCRHGYGQLGATLGAKTAARLAQENGVGTVALHEVNHVGRLGEYAEIIARQGCVGFVIAAGAGPGGSVAPFGGREAAFGTNPVAWSIPRRDVQEHLLLDRSGQPTSDPKDLFDGGVMLPFGGQKGSGLMFAIEIMVTLFCGFAPASSKAFKLGNPVLLTAWSIEAFTPRNRFDDLVEELCERVKSVAPAAGFDEVLLPGKVEARTQAERSRDGIPVPETLWGTLQELRCSTQS